MLAPEIIANRIRVLSTLRPGDGMTMGGKYASNVWTCATIGDSWAEFFLHQGGRKCLIPFSVLEAAAHAPGFEIFKTGPQGGRE